MHAFRRLITDQMDANGWRPADLVRASDLSPQQVSNMLNDDRDFLDAMPKRDTMRALAWAFKIDEGTVFRAAAAAYGVPIGPVAQAHDVGSIANDVLVREIARRLGVGIRITITGGTATVRVAASAANNPGKHEKRR